MCNMREKRPRCAFEAIRVRKVSCLYECAGPSETREVHVSLTRGLVHATCFVLVRAKPFYAQNTESKHLKWAWRVSFDAQVRVRFGVWES